MTKGRSIRCLSTASIYCACRKLGQPITLEQLVASSGIGRKEIGRCYRIIIRELGLSIPRATLRPCLAHLLNEIDAEAEVANIANRLLETVEECGIATGREPSGICSAVVYMASKLIGNVKTQRRISDAAGVTETTIRKRCREIERHVQFDICL